MIYISVLWFLNEICNRGCRRCLSRSTTIGEKMTMDQTYEFNQIYSEAKGKEQLAAGFYTVSGFGEPFMYPEIEHFTLANVGMAPAFTIVTSGAETAEEESRLAECSQILSDAQNGLYFRGTKHEQEGKPRIASISLTIDETERSRARVARSLPHLPERSYIKFVVDDPRAEIDHMTQLFWLYDILLESGYRPALLHTPHSVPEEKIHWKPKLLSLGNFREPGEFVDEVMSGLSVYFRGKEKSLIADFSRILLPLGRAIDNYPYLIPDRLCCYLEPGRQFLTVSVSHKGISLCPHSKDWYPYSQLVELAESAKDVMGNARETLLEQRESWNKLRCLCEICPLRMALT